MSDDNNVDVNRRQLLKYIGAISAAGSVKLASEPSLAINDENLIQLSKPTDLCNSTPDDNDIALIETDDTKMRSFYTGTSDNRWAFVGWLQQTEPDTRADGSVSPSSDAVEPPSRIIQVWNASDLQQYRPNDQSFAFVESEKSFYAGTPNNDWAFVGWTRRTDPATEANGDVTPTSTASSPDNRLIQVWSPSDLDAYNPTDQSLAFIERDRSFYAGTPNNDWAFIGWLQQTQPTETLNETIDPNSSECGGSNGSDDTNSGDNYVYLTSDQLQTQKDRATNGEEPFATALYGDSSHQGLLERADNALNKGLESVTDDDGDHRFKADTNNRHDYRSAIRTSEAARDLALAYRFDGNNQYAEQAIALINHWFLEPDTYMEPNTSTINTPYGIEQWITIPAFIYAAGLLRDHPAWDTYNGSQPWRNTDANNAENAFKQWVRDWEASFHDLTYCQSNNIWTWRIASRAAAAAYLGDDTMMQLAKDMFKADAKTQCQAADGSDVTRLRPWYDYVTVDTNNGYFQHEVWRENGFSYTGYNLLAFTNCCTIFEAYDGTDLWDYAHPDPDVNTTTPLRNVFNWFSPFVKDTTGWEYNSDGVTITDGDIQEACSAYELAYAHWNDYKTVLDNPERLNGRPYRDRRVLGPVTLTHGR